MRTRVDSGYGMTRSTCRWATCRGWLRSMFLVCITWTGAWGWAAEITDLQFSTLPGGRFEVKLVFDEAPPQPEIYTIERPARIALDFPNASSGLKEKKFTLGYENATSAVILEGRDRTRMVLNLVQLAAYDTRIEGNVLYVEVGDSGAREYLKPVAESETLAALTREPATARDSAVRGIDFQRGDDGEGQLIIDLNDPKTEVSVTVEGERIKVQLKGTQLPESLQRNYDVEDFATPVRAFRAESGPRGSTITLRARGDYDYLAYQANNRYVVSVKPLTAEEVEERKGEFAYTGERLSLNFQDIEVRAVLQLIAEFTGLNLVASDTVQGKITLRLQNVPWDQALDLVLKTKSLGQRQIGNVLLVAPAAEIAERERRELENRKQVAELASLQTEHVQVRYASASALAQMFSSGDGKKGESMLSERGRIIVDERTNTLLITETAAKIEDFRRVIRALDIPVRQVLIEARIVIANSNVDEALGIRWGVSGVERHGRRTISFGDSLLGALEDAEQGRRSGSLNVDLGPTRSPFGQFAIGYASENALLGLELAALEAQGRGEVVSQPKVITGDNQQATIKSGQEVPYQESSANGETTVSFKEAVLKLDVKPSITPDDRIILQLVINQDSIGEEVPTGQFGGFVPTIDTTELQTQVLVKNGETVVLGGVFRTEQLESEDKVPFLGDIPYVGRLFKRSLTSQTKVETLIFITPRILADTLID